MLPNFLEPPLLPITVTFRCPKRPPPRPSHARHRTNIAPRATQCTHTTQHSTLLPLRPSLCRSPADTPYLRIDADTIKATHDTANSAAKHAPALSLPSADKGRPFASCGCCYWRRSGSPHTSNSTTNLAGKQSAINKSPMRDPLVLRAPFHIDTPSSRSHATVLTPSPVYHHPPLSLDKKHALFHRRLPLTR